MFGRYEFHNDETNSHKFWSCEPSSPGYCEIRWGRVGSDGSSQIKPLDEGQRKISEKISKGYRLVKKYSALTKTNRNLLYRDGKGQLRALSRVSVPKLDKQSKSTKSAHDELVEWMRSLGEKK